VALGDPIWATADGYPRYPPGLREIGRSLPERIVPTPQFRLKLFEPELAAGYFGVGLGRVQPGRSLDRDALGAFADEYVV
jgi:hypothetical protein